MSNSPHAAGVTAIVRFPALSWGWPHLLYNRFCRVSSIFPSSPKLAGPVKHAIPNTETVILTCDRSLKWPAVLGLGGIGLLVAGLWVHLLWLYWFFFGLPALVAALYFALLRSNVVLSRKTGTLELRPMVTLFQTRHGITRLSFSEIREFLVESEFELGEGKPFVWHLTAIKNDGTHARLTWHFAPQPILLAGDEAARVTGKPLREEPDPLKSSTWSHWGYNFLR
jgi:hypothetical protein